jgi:hypothetical protein
LIENPMTRIVITNKITFVSFFVKEIFFINLFIVYPTPY